MPAVLWFRRDLRLSDHPALCRAHGADRTDEPGGAGAEVLPLFVLDPALARRPGRRLDRLLASLAALDRELGGRLVVRSGRPSDVVPRVAAEASAATVHVSAETTPYGRRRDAAVAEALGAAGRELVATGSSYAVGPGLVVKADGSPYSVFTPFSRAWRDHGWPAPAPRPEVSWVTGVPSDGVPSAGQHCPEAGERAALDRWRRFVAEDLDDYATARDRPDLDATSRMSVPLKYGEIHPRSLLADLAGRGGAGVAKLLSELAWREFYADVLWHHPSSAWTDLRPALHGMHHDDPVESGDLVSAWQEGRTGYPLVDAGMRQLRTEGFLHNRVRMITASFLVKDLHVWWPVGARHFLDLLLDGDLASNNHGWQWVAGTGTDAAPYFRVFNPVLQGERFDPDGDYVRRWVPELAHLPGAAAHQPWRHPRGYDRGYPERVVDHAVERKEALRRLDEVRSRR